MGEIAKEMKTCILLFAFVCVLSLAFPLLITWVAETIMPYQAHGSLLYVNGTVVGSELFGQSFTSPRYFHSRPSAVDYNGSNSGGSNLGPTSAKLINQTHLRVDQFRRENGLASNASVPADMVLSSGSGLDPHISIEGANLQVARVARVRELPESKVQALVDQYTETPQFGILGQTKVNVLKLNIALDELTNGSKR
jgi:potassium-transporting ATPase KdpC subunit